MSSRSYWELYTDGSAINPHKTLTRPVGGWGSVVLPPTKASAPTEFFEYSGGFLDTTNNQMEIKAVTEGLKTIPEKSLVAVYSDSFYVVKTMWGHFRRKKNLDFWAELDEQLARHNDVIFNWLRGHSFHKFQNMADELCGRETLRLKNELM